MSDLQGQLEAVRQQLDASNPELYRHLALYLQVLRQILPGRVEQACFHLATQVHPQRYGELSDERRHHLHQRLQVLIRRCTTLLTVEQLVSLADQISRERQRRERQEQRLLLDQLEDTSPDPPSEGGLDSDGPQGSVHLGLSLPLSGSLFGFAGLNTPRNQRTSEPESPEQEFGSARDTNADEDRAESMAGAFAAAMDASLDDALSRSEEPTSSLWQQGRLPRDPVQLLRWMDGMELAIARRLRNLSHALNVELLRAGISRSLLPLSLLDAVLSGQLELLAAPANVLRLQLPFGPPSAPGGDPLQTLAVLLRMADLEMEEPRLRTCRRRMLQHRQEVRRMAQQFRRIQRRLQAHAAEQLWLQDIRQTPPHRP